MREMTVRKTLSQEKKRTLVQYLSVALLTLIVQVSVLGLLDIYSSGLSVGTLQGAVLFVLLLGLANSLILPYLMYFSVRWHPLIFPVLAFLLNGILVIIVSEFVPSVYISSIWTAIGVSIIISMTGMIVGSLFAADDFKAYERFVVHPLMRRYGVPRKSDVPGVMFLEIDGLSQAVFQKALGEGYMPTLKRWLEDGSHKFTGWETDLSCQTGGCQPGILHGNNSNIPAFRWYEKDNAKLLTSEKPHDVAEVEKRVSDGNGLLAKNGSSRANMYSGDAKENMLTISTLGSTKRNTMEYFLFYANPFMAPRTFALFLSHFMVEVLEGWLQIARDERPRVHRTGFYPIQRATTTSILRELSMFSLVGDMLRGLPAMYATFVGYDEVAHHSGVARKDALRVLSGLDKSFEWLERISEKGARPYRFVVLSDHGQSNGATFLRRTGKTFGQVVDGLVDLETYSPPAEDETWLRVNALLTDVSRQNTRGGRLVNRAVKNKKESGEVALGPKGEELKPEEKNKAIVLASGNLGLIYFTAWKERMSLEQINEAFPNLIPGLLTYPEVGFVAARSELHGPLVIGPKGIYYLKDDRFEGENPLANYGLNAALHLRREDGFTNAPDLLVNSFYDMQKDEVAAFEELVGSHGGMGGSQSKAILVYPSDLDAGAGTEPIVGASHLHQIIKRWVPEE
jgi:putative membrane protein